MPHRKRKVKKSKPVSVLPYHMFFDSTKADFNRTNPSARYASTCEHVKALAPMAGIQLSSLLVAGLLTSKVMNNYYKSESSPNQKYIVIVVALLMTIYQTFSEIKEVPYRTKLYAENGKRRFNSNEISEALAHIQRNSPAVYQAWKNKINIYLEQDIIKYLEKKLEKSGQCFGHSMAAIEALVEHPFVHGKDLIPYLRFQTIVEKTILQYIAVTLESDASGIEGMYAFSSTSKVAAKARQLAYKNFHTDYLNNNTDAITIKDSKPEDIMKSFNRQLASPAFIDVSHYTIHRYHNSVYPSIDNSKLMTCREKKELSSLESSQSTSNLSQLSKMLSIIHFKAKLNLDTRRQNFISKHLAIMSKDTILTGEICLNDKKNMSHSIMFRHSNGFYYFFDSNYGVDEFKSSREFFEGLHKHIINYYVPVSSDSLEVGFIMHAMNTKNQLCTFQEKPKATRVSLDVRR